MKKLISVLTLVFTLVLSLGFLEVEAADPLIEVYPYNSLDCSLGNDDCGFAKVGRNNWTVTYNGYRYWVINDNTRYAHEFNDANSDGYISPGEYQGLRYNAFGVLFINNTAATVKLKGDAARADLTTVTHRIWSYYDETGVLQMLENQIHTTHMVNDNHGVEGAEADWRLATAIEAEEYDAAPADAKPANMLNTHYRIIRSATDTDGYVMEPLKYIQWVHKDYDPDVEGSKKSTLLDYDPIEAHIPAGWSVLTFGTHDRGAYPPALNMVLSLPATFLDEVPKTAEMKYNDVPAVFTGFAGLDDNPYIAGVQVVADFDEPFELDASGLKATYTNMYDAEGNVINERNVPIDFALEVSQDGVVLETIDYVYDPVAEKYTASGPFTKVDTSVFEQVYDLKMKATTPRGVAGEVSGIIVVGVLPNRFEGVSNKIIRDGQYIDLLEGVEGFNGNDVDITDDIVVSWSAGFNPYNPQPGKYTITLDVAYEYHWAPVLTDDAQTGFKLTFTNVSDPENPVVRGTNVVRYPSKYNVHFNKEASPLLTYIDYEHRHLVAQTAGLGWGSVAGVVRDGKLIHTWNGFSSYTEKNELGETTAHANGEAMQTSIRAFELQPGDYMILAHGSEEGNNIRHGWGDEVLLEGRPDVYYTAEAQVTYQVTVDDRTAPQIRVVNPNYVVDSTMFETADEAILANVVAFDNHSADVDLLVNDDGGLDLAVPGVYTVVVDAEDDALNSASVTFKVIVVAPKLTQAEVADLLDEQAAELQEVIDAQAALIAAQQAALAALEEQIEEDNATKDELAAAKAEAAAAAQQAQQAAAAAQQAANAAQTTADDNATQIDKVDDAKLGTGANIGLMILFALVGAGLSFGASFLVFGRKK